MTQEVLNRGSGPIRAPAPNISLRTPDGPTGSTGNVGAPVIGDVVSGPVVFSGAAGVAASGSATAADGSTITWTTAADGTVTALGGNQTLTLTWSATAGSTSQTAIYTEAGADSYLTISSLFATDGTSYEVNIKAGSDELTIQFSGIGKTGSVCSGAISGTLSTAAAGTAPTQVNQVGQVDLSAVPFAGWPTAAFSGQFALATLFTPVLSRLYKLGSQPIHADEHPGVPTLANSGGSTSGSQPSGRSLTNEQRGYIAKATIATEIAIAGFLGAEAVVGAGIVVGEGAILGVGLAVAAGAAVLGTIVAEEVVNSGAFNQPTQPTGSGSEDNGDPGTSGDGDGAGVGGPGDANGGIDLSSGSSGSSAPKGGGVEGGGPPDDGSPLDGGGSPVGSGPPGDGGSPGDSGSSGDSGSGGGGPTGGSLPGGPPEGGEDSPGDPGKTIAPPDDK